MYQIIASEYDSLFPHPQDKTAFVETRITEKTKKILDLGCATGELLISLSQPDRILTGIDLDKTMIDMAKQKTLNRKNRSAEFIHGDMIDYLKNGEPLSQDMLLCFGNTLAYLKNPAQLNKFLNWACEMLRPDGQFIIQILNFDNPLIKPGFNFPELDTERIIFSRNYYEDPGGGILFSTKVYHKDSETTLKETHRLFPFTRIQIEKAADNAGFNSCQVLGGYKGERPEKDDFSRLFILGK